MTQLILFLLILFFAFGYIKIPGFFIRDIPLFTVNRHSVTLWELFIFILIIWTVEILPTPFRQIAMAGVLLWVLSTLGIIAISGLSTILTLAFIIGLIIAVLFRQ